MGTEALVAIIITLVVPLNRTMRASIRPDMRLIRDLRRHVVAVVELLIQQKVAVAPLIQQKAVAPQLIQLKEAVVLPLIQQKAAVINHLETILLLTTTTIVVVKVCTYRHSQLRRL